MSTMKLSRPSRAWLVLTGQAAAGKAVDHEGRDAHRVELVHPGLAWSADAAGAVHQHHDRKLADALRDAEFAGDGDRLAVGIAAEELLVGEGERRDRIDLDARGHFLGQRLRVGLDAGEQTPVQRSPRRRRSASLTASFPPSPLICGK